MNEIRIEGWQWRRFEALLAEIAVNTRQKKTSKPDMVSNPAAGLVFQCFDTTGGSPNPQHTKVAMIADLMCKAEDAAAIQAIKDLGAREERERIIAILTSGAKIPADFQFNSPVYDFDPDSRTLYIANPFLKSILEPSHAQNQ